MTTENKSLSISPLIIILAVIGMIAQWFISSKWGIGLSPDSSGYLYAARGLMNGKGLIEISQWNKVIPLCNFAPMVSTLLGFFGVLGIEPMIGARWLHIVVFGGNIFLSGFIIFHYTRSNWASTLTSFFVLTSLVTLEIHAMLWSEPIFIFFGFAGIYLLALALEDESKKPVLIPSALVLGLSFLSKYSGASFILAGVLTAFFFSKKTYLKRIINCLLIGAVSSLPMTLWSLRNRLSGTWPAGLTFNFEPYLMGHVRALFAYISIWILPKSISPVFRGVVLLLLIGFFISAAWVCASWAKRYSSPNKVSGMFYGGPFPWILLIVMASHIGVYFAATAFMGENSFDNRALSPVFVSCAIFMVGTGCDLWRLSQQFSWRRNLLSVLLIFFVISYFFRAVQWGVVANRDGLWYSSREWNTSGIIEKIKQYTGGIPIYTNGPDVVYLLTGKPASAIPAKSNVFKVHVPDPERRLLQNYPLELEKMRKDLRKNQGIVVYLDKIYWRWYYPTADELMRIVPLGVVERVQGGTIYKMEE